MRRRDPPGPRYLSPKGLYQLRRNPLAFLSDAAARFGDIVCFRAGPLRSYMIFHPSHLRHVLQDNHDNYIKGFLLAKTKVLIGDGLFSSEGASWRRQRRILQPAFHRQRIADFVATTAAKTNEMLERWESAARAGTRLDLAAEMSRVTLDVIGTVLFDQDLTAKTASVGEALLVALEFVSRRAMSVVALPVAVPTPRNRRFQHARAALDRIVYEIINTRRRDDGAAGDLLSLLIDARDESGDALSDQQVRDQVFTFVVAGYETTSVALAWTWLLLSENPAVEERLREEVRSVLDGRAPTIDDLTALAYTRTVIQEAMRLYPPLWAFPRQSIAADTIDAYDIPAGATFSVVPYLTHRMPAFWPDPLRFDPDRFTPEQVAGRPRCAYAPFGGGPRQCIGSEFAIAEAQVILAMAVQRYRATILPERSFEPIVSITARPSRGVPAVLAAA